MFLREVMTWKILINFLVTRLVVCRSFSSMKFPLDQQKTYRKCTVYLLIEYTTEFCNQNFFAGRKNTALLYNFFVRVCFVNRGFTFADA